MQTAEYPPATRAALGYLIQRFINSMPHLAPNEGLGIAGRSNIESQNVEV